MSPESIVEKLQYAVYFGGLKGLTQAVLHRIPFARDAVKWWDGEHEWFGRIVEGRGNKVEIDGCIFSVSDPLITTGLKGRFLTARYEPSERYAVRRFVSGRTPVVELGGSLGVVACITNCKLADPTRHVVVEANPDLIPILERNRELNNCRFCLENKVLAYEAAYVDFPCADTVVESGVYYTAGRSIPVASTSLEGILESYEFDTCDLVCDIEGSEADLFANEAETIRDRVETIVIEFHPAILGNRRTMDLIDEIEGYFRQVWRRHGVAVYRNRGKAK